MTKKSFTIFYILLMFGSFSNLYADVSVEVGVFYEHLAPYGDWIYHDRYGVWVWRPVGLWPDWQPYTYGRWEWSEEYGWIWVSYFEWGWAPFHYGRWFYDEYYGWVWVPGTVWRPHWVVWIHYGPYIGWYPYYPSFVHIDYYSPVIYERWVIIETTRISSGNYHHHVLPKDRRGEIFSNTSGSHRFIPKEDDSSYHNYGPPKAEIEKAINKKIEPIKPEFVDKPANIYKPNEKKFAIYKPDFKSKIPDIGYLKNNDRLRNQPDNTSGYSIKKFPSDNEGNNIRPRYTVPLGKSHIIDSGYEVNEGVFRGHNKGVINKSINSPYMHNSPVFKNGGGQHSDNKLKEEAVKSYSPNKGQGIHLPKFDSDDSDDDDSNYKKNIPKLSPKGTTAPKLTPNFKGK